MDKGQVWIKLNQHNPEIQLTNPETEVTFPAIQNAADWLNVLVTN